MNKINANLLMNFVKKASLNGNIMSINLNFTEQGLESSVKDLTYVALTTTSIKPESFIEYQPIGEIFIKNTTDFMKYLKSFPEEVTLEVFDGYNMKLSNVNREIHVLLGSEIICENVNRRGEPKLEFTASFNVKKSFLKKAIDDMNTIKIKAVTIIKESDKVKLEVGVKGESDYFVNSDTTNVTEPTKIEVGAHILNLFSSIDEDVIVSIMNNGPMKVEEQHENICFSCFIAPIIRTEA